MDSKGSGLVRTWEDTNLLMSGMHVSRGSELINFGRPIRTSHHVSP
jgi:hypothetical protein